MPSFPVATDAAAAAVSGSPTSTTAATPVASSVAIFFFAREKLLFRYPDTDPFAVDLTQQTSGATTNVAGSAGGGGGGSGNAGGGSSTAGGSGLPAASPPALSSSSIASNYVSDSGNGKNGEGVQPSKRATAPVVGLLTSSPAVATTSPTTDTASRGMPHKHSISMSSTAAVEISSPLTVGAAVVGSRLKKMQQQQHAHMKIATEGGVGDSTAAGFSSSTNGACVAPQRGTRRQTAIIYSVNNSSINSNNAAVTTTGSNTTTAAAAVSTATLTPNGNAASGEAAEESVAVRGSSPGTSGKRKVLTSSDGRGPARVQVKGAHRSHHPPPPASPAHNTLSTAQTSATCVGIQPNVLMHLLRGATCGSTTISMLNCTFLVFPLSAVLIPSSDRSHRGEEFLPSSLTASFSDVEDSHRQSRTGTVLLVVAMKQPDSDSGAISKFVQCFLNIIFREEQRCRYVSTQVYRMERLTHHWEAGGLNALLAAAGQSEEKKTTDGERRDTAAAATSNADGFRSGGYFDYLFHPPRSALRGRGSGVANSSSSGAGGAAALPLPPSGSGVGTDAGDVGEEEVEERSGSLAVDEMEVKASMARRTAHERPSSWRGTPGVDASARTATTGSSAVSSSTSLYAQLTTHVRLAWEMVQIAKFIDEWNQSGRAVGAFLPQGKVADGEPTAPSRRSCHGQTDLPSPSAVPLSTPVGIFINQLLYLPTDNLTGRAIHVEGLQQRSPYTRLHPCSILNLVSDSISDDLQREYVELVGRRYAKLLPLSTVHQLLQALSPPRRIGALYRSVELALLEAVHRRRHTRLAVSHSTTGEGVAVSNSTSHLRSSRDGLEEDINAASTTAAMDREAAVVAGQAASLDFLAVEVIDFLRSHGLISANADLHVCFTHGDVTPTVYMEAAAARRRRRERRVARRQHANAAHCGKRNSHDGDAETTASSCTAAASTGAELSKDIAALRTVPSLLVLEMLEIVLHDQQQQSHTAFPINVLASPSPQQQSTVSSPTGVGGAAFQQSSSTGNITTNISHTPPSSETESSVTTSLTTSRYPSTSNGKPSHPPRASTVLTTASTPSPHMSTTAAVVAAGEGKVNAAERGTTSELNLSVYCAWGSACPICEQLAVHPRCWTASGVHSYAWGPGHTTPVPTIVIPAERRRGQWGRLQLQFPCLDPSVRACAKHVRRLRDYVDLATLVQNNYHGGSSAVGQRTASGLLLLMQPWFLRPDMFVAPVTTAYGGSAYQMFLRMSQRSGNVCGASVSGGGRGGGSGGVPGVSSLIEPKRQELLPTRQRSTAEAHNLNSVDAQVGSTYHAPTSSAAMREEDGQALLLLSDIPTDAVGYLQRSASVIAERLAYSHRQQQLIEQWEQQGLSKKEVPSPSTTADLAISTQYTTTPPILLEPGDGIPASASSVPSSLWPAAADGGGGSSVGMPRSLRYGRRQLPLRVTAPVASCCKLYSTNEVEPDAADGNETRSRASATTGAAGVTERTPISLASVPVGANLVGADRYVPAEVLIQFVLHHLIVFTWGCRGVEVEALVRRLERNLRRLRPFLANLPYVLQLRGAGCTSETTVAVAGGAGTIRDMMGDAGGAAVSSAFTAVHTKTATPATAGSTSLLHDTTGSCNSDATANPAPPAAVPAGAPPLSPSDLQLLQTYEIFEQLSLLDVLTKYAAYPIRPVPTRLLLHCVVNEFSDILFCG